MTLPWTACAGMGTISIPIPANPTMYAPTMYAGPGDNVYTTQSVVYRQREPGQVRLELPSSVPVRLLVLTKAPRVHSYFMVA